MTFKKRQRLYWVRPKSGPTQFFSAKINEKMNLEDSYKFVDRDGHDVQVTGPIYTLR